MIGDSTRKAGSEVPVVCGLCGTRMYASKALIGTAVRCPDCHSETVVPEPPPPPKKVKSEFTGDEFQLKDVGSLGTEVEQVTLNCVGCQLLMRAKVIHVGKDFACPNCNTVNVVPSPTSKTNLPIPDTSDITLDEEPPVNVDPAHKEFADRLMTVATEEVIRKEEERPKPPAFPFLTGVYSFPFQLNVFPLWFCVSVAVMIALAMADMVDSLMSAVSVASILAIFISIAISLVTLITFGVFAPHLLWIVEYTAAGYSKSPHSPSHDLIERMRAMLFLINSIGLSVIPGILFFIFSQAVGGLHWLCFLAGLLLLPLILLSMLQADSVFTPYSRKVAASVRAFGGSWLKFYSQTLCAAMLLFALTILCLDVNPMLARLVICVGLSWYAVLYARLLGRLAWVIGDRDSAGSDGERDRNDTSSPGGCR